MINVERFLDKVNLIHMLRIAYAGDDLRATYFFGKGRDDHVLFVAVCAGNQKIEGANGASSEQADLFGVADDRHDIVLLGNAIDDRFVLIYDGNGMIASGQRIGHFETKLAGTDNGYFHENLLYCFIGILSKHVFDYFASKKNVKKLQAAASVNVTNLF